MGAAPGLPGSLPAAFGTSDKLTKQQNAILEKGGAQLIQQHVHRVKANYAIATSAQVEDHASSAFTRVATNIALRTHRSFHPPEVQPYLNMYMDASLRRVGPALLQIASDHHRSQNEIASEVVEISEDAPTGFWAKLLGDL